MAKKPETLFKEKVKSALATLPHSWFEKIQQVAIRGTPDFVGVIRSRFIAIELKKSLKEEPDPLQNYKLGEIAEAGGMSFVMAPENFQDTFNYLLELANGGEFPDFH